MDATTARFVLVLNDSPYGSERFHNAMRMALALRKVESAELKVFLFGDAVAAAKSGQQLPSGQFNAEIALRSLVRSGAEIGA